MTAPVELGLADMLSDQANHVRLGIACRTDVTVAAGYLADYAIEAADAITSLIAERDGLRGQVQRKQDLLDSFVSFVHRWSWVKAGNGTSDSERLDVIKHYPPVALHNATALSLDTNKGDGV